MVLATLFSVVVIRSPLGFAFRALRDNEEYAVSRGINRFKFQLLVFASSAFFTGLAGGIYAGHFKVMGAESLLLSLLLFLAAMMVIGGVGRLWGPLLGAAALMLVDDLLKDYLEYRHIVLGLIIVVFAMLWPQGIVGAIEKLWGWLKVRKGKESALPVEAPARSTSPDDR